MKLVLLTSLLLAVYFGFIIWAWLQPSGDDPQRGMAVGFLMMATVFFLGLASLLWYGASHNRRGLVWTVFIICALPSLSLVGRVIYLLVRWLRRS